MIGLLVWALIGLLIWMVEARRGAVEPDFALGELVLLLVCWPLFVLAGAIHGAGLAASAFSVWLNENSEQSAETSEASEAE